MAVVQYTFTHRTTQSTHDT